MKTLDNLKFACHRLPSYVSEVSIWLRPKRATWYGLIAPLLAFAICQFPSTLEPMRRLQIIALVFQLGGLLVVAIGVLQTQREFSDEKRTVVVRLRDKLSRRPRWRGKTFTLEVVDSLKMHGTVTVDSNLRWSIGQQPTEAELAAIKHRLGHVETRQVRTDQEFESQTQKQEQNNKEVAKKIQNLATGGVALQVISWIWIAVGTVIGTVPDVFLGCCK